MCITNSGFLRIYEDRTTFIDDSTDFEFQIPFAAIEIVTDGVDTDYLNLNPDDEDQE
jgi:hypothetical protein